MKFEITKELLEATLQYLAGKPYIEVAQLIEALRSLKTLEDKKE